MREIKTKLVKLRGELQALRKTRNELNDTVKALKRNRDELRDLAKKNVVNLKRLRKATGRTIEGIRAQHDMAELEWKIQTSILEREEEKRLLARVKNLESKVDSHKKIQHLSATVDTERDEAGKLHEKIQEVARASQAHHEDILSLGERFTQLREKLDEQAKILSEIRARKRDVTQKYFSIMTMTRQADKISQTQREKAHKDSLKETAKKKLAHGEKLSLHELGALYDDETEEEKG